MKMSVKIGLFAALTVLSSASIAGEPVQGSGPTKSAAADDADRRAIQQGGCEKVITHAKLSQCTKESDGTWTCTAYVANHESC